MTKRNKTIYWISTGLLAVAMLNSGVIQLLKIKADYV